VGLNRELGRRHPAWMAGWLSCPESPGFHPGLLVFVPGPEGRVDSKRAQARQANRGTTPRVRVQHAPGFPPGASWTGDETDFQFKGSATQRSQADCCSGDALPSHSAQHQKAQAIHLAQGSWCVMRQSRVERDCHGWLCPRTASRLWNKSARAGCEECRPWKPSALPPVGQVDKGHGWLCPRTASPPRRRAWPRAAWRRRLAVRRGRMRLAVRVRP